MRKLFTLLFALICCTMYADELYLVGDGTPIGWQGDGNIRQITKMTETAPGVYEWVGALKHAEQGFKIVNSFGGWDGYHPSSENFAIAESGTDYYTTEGNDWKWNPANTEAKVYKITLNQTEKTLSWEPAALPFMDDEVIYVGTAEELHNLAVLIRNNMDSKQYTVKLTADIDYTAYNEGILAAIGPRENAPFAGDFDGQGHTITINMETKTTRMGLFGTIVGKVHDLKVAGKITVKENNQVGGFCGLLKGDGSAIYNCVSAVEFVDGASGDGTIAGIAAVAYDHSTLENCAFYGKVSAPNRDGNGGIVSWANSNTSITIKNCLVVADINWKDGADFGRNNPTVINSYKPAADEPTLASGDFAYEKLNGKVSGGVWGQELGIDALPSPLSTTPKIYANGNFYCDGKTSKDADFVLSNIDASNVDPHEFDANGVCSVCHEGYEKAEIVDGVFQIANFGNMMDYANYVNAGHTDACAVLTADIVMSEGAVYTPAGTASNVFTGTFDGQLHSVTLEINNPTENYQGLFGIATDGATIKNVVVRGSVVGNNYVAGIVGGSNGSVDGKTLNIINCANEAVIEAAGANGAGIIGVNMSGIAHFNIVDCYNAGSVTSGKEAGAITGWTGGDRSTLKNCFNIGEVYNGYDECLDFVRGGGNIVNCWAFVANSGAQELSYEAMMNGELCYTLGEAFGQTIGEDFYPNFFGKKVYALVGAYANIDNMETANGDAECLLPSIKWGGSYKAYTNVQQADYDYGETNTSNPNYNKIIGVPAEQDGKAWYTPGYNVNEWNYGKDLPNFGNGKPADVYAVRYFTVEGEIPTTLYMPAAHDDAPCEYYINGEKIWGETDGWKEDEVVRLTDAQKALIKTDGTVNVFAFHVHQNWGGRYADGGLYTAGNMVNDFNNDVRTLDLLIGAAEAAGVEATYLDAAKTKSNYRAGIASGRDYLNAAWRVQAVDKQENVFTGAAPEDGGQYYLYNVGAKRYLTGGDEYCTHAAVNFAAQAATFRANGENFRIHTNIRNGSDALNHNGFVDCPGDGDSWFLTEVQPGIYTIARDNNHDLLLGYDGLAENRWQRVDTDRRGAENENNQWILVTKEERDALLATATEENPVDATYYIHAAGFDHWLVPATLAWPFTKWTWNNGGDGGWEPDFVYEVWHAGETEMSQTLEGLPEGKYIVSAQGYYRDGDNKGDFNYAGVAQEAVLFAGEKSEALLPNIAAEADKYPVRGNADGGHGIVPDSREDAANYFEVGLYKVSVEAEVGEDGKLKIGARKSANVANDWMVIDNFRLTYLGKKGTGIDTVESNVKMENAPIYNLAGQRISKMQKGINIVGNKKVMK